MNRSQSLTVASLFLAVACSKPSTEEASPEGAAPPPITARSAVGSAPAPDASASAGAVRPAEAEEVLPTERHAERKAASEITPSNYKVELSKLAKEIGTP